MQRVFVRFSVTGLLVLGVIAAVGWLPQPGVLAQDGGECVQLVSGAVVQAGDVCAGLTRGSVCLGYTGVSATTADGAAAGLAAPGDTVDVSGLVGVSTQADPAAGTWGVALLSLAAGLPDPEAVSAAVFGNAELTQPAGVQADRPTLTVTNTGGSDVNVRNGAGVSFDVVGVLAPGASAEADGRNEQGDWVRIRLENGAAWVFARVISWEGDLNTLEVLPPGDVTLPVTAGEPFGTLKLATGPDSELCGSTAPSGLLLQYVGEAAASLLVNDTLLEFSDATLLLRAQPNEALEISVLSGSGTITARGVLQEMSAGGGVRVTLGGDDGLTPVDAPVVLDSYLFPTVAYAPLGLLSGTVPCAAGLPSEETRVIVRVGPGENRGEIGELEVDTSYPVAGWANAADGAPWWKLEPADQELWVPQAGVAVLGACDVVAEAEVPPLVFASPSAPTGGEGGADDGVDDFSPDGNSVWQMQPGSDNMSGECSGSPAINFCDHLAAISPASGGIMWKGMEPSPYYLTRLRANVYAYSGPTVQGNGTVNMTLTFTSESAVKMTMVVTLTSEPNCHHTYYYSGNRNW